MRPKALSAGNVGRTIAKRIHDHQENADRDTNEGSQGAAPFPAACGATNVSVITHERQHTALSNFHNEWKADIG